MPDVDRSRVTSSASREARARCGAPSTGCPTAARSSGRSGTAWTAARPAAARATSRKRTAEAWLRDVLAQARARARCPGWSGRARRSRTPADEYLRYLEHDRQRKPSTLRDYALDHPQPPAAAVRRRAARGPHAGAGRALGARARRRPAAGEPHAREDHHDLPRRDGAGAQASTGCRSNPVADVEKPRHRAAAAEIEVFSPEEVMALVRARRRPSRTPRSSSPPRSPACARASSSRCAGATSTSPAQHIRVRASYTNGHLTSPKSGKVRSVPMAPEVAEALARLGQRERCDRRRRPRLRRHRRRLPRRLRAARSATERALQRAGLRPLRFHDLRHTFGTRVIGEADIRRVQEWMGHADVADDDAVPALRAAAGGRGARRARRSVRNPVPISGSLRIRP